MAKHTHPRFIQRAIKRPGALRRALGIKKGRKIPSSVLSKIARAKIGKRISVDGKITVTRKLKKRAVLARTLRRFR